MEDIEYELVDISFSLTYKIPEEEFPGYVSEGSVDLVKEKNNTSHVEYDADGIPMGCSREETIKRRHIISEHLRKWREEHKDNPRVYNENLKDYIKVNQVFMIESKEHAAMNYKSTKAVLNMETVMAKAVKLGETLTKKGNSNQRPFQQMIVMHYKSDELGDVKMTVGVRFRTKEKVEYSINVPSPGTAFIDDTTKVKKQINPPKRKKHSK